MAKRWYEFNLKKKNYDYIKKNSFAYFEVKINVNDENFLDLEDVELKDKITEIVLIKNFDRKTSEEKISALYDYFIKKLEDELEANYYVWQLRVNAPYTANDYPLNTIGNPISYVVNKNSLITVLNCFVLEENCERKFL